jgi:hypothetical protein
MDLKSLKEALGESDCGDKDCTMLGRPSDILPSVDWAQDAIVGYRQNVEPDFDYSKLDLE